MAKDNKTMKLLLFDVDGTIIDSQNIIVTAMNNAFNDIGLTAPTREKTLSIVGLSLPNAMAALVGEEGPIETLVAAYKNAFAQLRLQSSIASPFFDGAKALLEELMARHDVLLGLATGKSRRGVKHLLENCGWEQGFVTIQTADDAASKPDPDMIYRAMAETGVEPHELVMIGDTVFDMEMADRAGVRSIGVSWGYHSKEALSKHGADIIVDSYSELRKSLQKFITDGTFF